MQLLERTSQLQMLDSALTLAKSGQGCVALVYGEAGIGKTSLVEHFIKEHKTTWRILQGACDSLFTPRPLGPLHDIALQIQGSLLALLTAESNRAAIFSTCLNELNEQTTILVIEDIHWADEATLDLLKYVGRRIRKTTSLMILTYRDDEIGMDHPLRILLGDLVSSAVLHRVPVSSFSKDVVYELAKNKNIDAVKLHRMTNGNPFFVTEVLAVESGIPETVRDAVLARAARLSLSARAVLEVAAVIGSRIEPWLLSNIVGAESVYIEECVSKGMLQSQGDMYAFRHELARQTILESISPHRKITLHRMALNALKDFPETRKDFARLANHAEGTKDVEAVLAYSPAAARQASALGAHRQAAVHYKTVLQYASTLSAEKHAELLDSYSDECSLLDQRTVAKQAQEEALLIWREVGQREKEGRAFRRLSEIDHDFFIGLDREQNILNAIAILETLPPSIELARAYSHMARLHLTLNKASGIDPIHWGSRALELAERLEDVETIIHALNSIGAWEMALGKHIEGQAKLEHGLQLSLEHNLHFSAARTMSNLGNELKSLRDYSASLHYVEMGLEYSNQHDLDQWFVDFLTDRAYIRFQQGYWAEAHQDVQTILKLRDERETIEVFGIHSLLIQIQARRGDPFSPEVLDVVRQSAAEIEELDYRCRYAAFFAELAWLRDDLAQSRAEAEPTFQIVSQISVHPYPLIGFSELSYWMWRVGAIDKPPPLVIEPYATQIAGNWREAASLWEKFGCPYEQGMALMDGDMSAQLEALEIFERLGARPIIHNLKKQMRTQGIPVPRGPRPATRENPFGLTAREMEVLGSLVRGQGNNTIAKQLSLSTRTVEHHIASILRKLGVGSRTEAVALAVKDRLLNSE